MDSIEAFSISVGGDPTDFFNFSETITANVHPPTNPIDAFIGSVRNGVTFATTTAPSSLSGDWYSYSCTL